MAPLAPSFPLLPLVPVTPVLPVAPWSPCSALITLGLSCEVLVMTYRFVAYAAPPSAKNSAVVARIVDGIRYRFMLRFSATSRGSFMESL